MMNSEENRLRTFDAWDSSLLRMELKRELARNGFFATEIFAEAECAWCHCTLGVSNDCLQYTPIDERHKLLRPDCPFIVNYRTSGNIPINANKRKQPQASVTAAALLPPLTKQKRSEADGVDLFVEANRLATFENWPNPNISPQSLAKAGFYYLNRSDTVKCAWCKGVINEWEKEDTAFGEHRRFFPDCPKVQFGPHIEIASDAIREFGIQQIKKVSKTFQNLPKLFNYSSLDARLRTYTEWPISDIQQPEALAQAGFYYQNLDDEVHCFQCNIVLESWQKEDDPWFEHAKGNPQCSFVQLEKGVAYVQQVQEIVRQNGGTTEEPHASVCPPRISIDEAMSTIPVKKVLEMGIDAGCIRNPAQRGLCATGKPYSTVEDLLNAIFDDRIESEEALNESQAEAPIAENSGSLVFDEEVPNEENEEIVRQNGGTTEEPHASVCPPRISIDEAMSTIPVKQVLEMGIDAGCIRNAAQRGLCATGKPYSTVEDLLNAIFDDRIESEEALNESQAEAPIAENSGSLVFDEEVPNEEIVRQNGGTTEEPHASVCPPRISIDEAMSTIPVKQVLQMGIDAGCIRNAAQRGLCATGKPHSTVEDLLNAIFDDRIESEEALNESQAEAPIAENSGSLVFDEEVPNEDNEEIVRQNGGTTEEPHASVCPITRSLSLEEELRKVKNARLCKLCFAEQFAIAFLPCGHLVACVECASRVEQCPICCADIRDRFRIHFS